MIKKCLIAAGAVIVLCAGMAAAQTSPQEYLGHRVGADHKLADYNQIVAYFQKLDSESERLKLLEIGESTEGRTIIMAVISTEENMAQLDRYREITKRLRDAAGLTPEEARALAKEGKTLLLISCSLHALSTEFD